MRNKLNGRSLPEERYWLVHYKSLMFDRRSLPAWACLLIGLCFTSLTIFSLHQQHEKSGLEQFQLHVGQLVKSIQKRLIDHELILLGAAGLMDASDFVSRQEWRNYVDRLALGERYPGIQGVGYSKIFPASELPAHIDSVRAEGFPDFTVRPEGSRDIYSSIIYLEPFSGRNLAAFGYDMYSNPVRREAMKLAVDKNMTTISGKVRLVQETHGKEQAGFLMYVPVYRSGLPVETAEQRW